MIYYLVGGSVRDKLLGLKSYDKDWVVIGESPKSMLAKGFSQVGKNFPVFLHPVTKDEYALARKEIKSGAGYTGFKFDTNTNISLKEDLLRRDLTINAMAMCKDGKIIDPYNGQNDIKNKKLRHVSCAFSEDPLRVLRVARFAAQFAYLGFTIASETICLMKKISQQGEIALISPERIWQEIEKALATKNPEIFFQVLQKVQALKFIMPDLDSLFNQSSPVKHTNLGDYSLQSFKLISITNSNISIRFAALNCRINIEKTDSLKKILNTLRMPKKFLQLSILAQQYLHFCHQISQQSAIEILRFIQKCHALNNTELFYALISIFRNDYLNLYPKQNIYPSEKIILAIYTNLKSLDISKIVNNSSVKTGVDVKHIIQKHQTNVIAKQLIKFSDKNG